MQIAAVILATVVLLYIGIGYSTSGLQFTTPGFKKIEFLHSSSPHFHKKNGVYKYMYGYGWRNGIHVRTSGGYAKWITAIQWNLSIGLKCRIIVSIYCIHYSFSIRRRFYTFIYCSVNTNVTIYVYYYDVKCVVCTRRCHRIIKTIENRKTRKKSSLHNNWMRCNWRCRVLIFPIFIFKFNFKFNAISQLYWLDCVETWDWLDCVALEQSYARTHKQTNNNNDDDAVMMIIIVAIITFTMLLDRLPIHSVQTLGEYRNSFYSHFSHSSCWRSYAHTSEYTSRFRLERYQCLCLRSTHFRLI